MLLMNLPNRIITQLILMMQSFLPIIVLRHRRENLHKCSLRGLEKREDFRFLTYPSTSLPADLSSYVLLTMDGPILSPTDSERGLFIVDGTWRYAEKMIKVLDGQAALERRSLPTCYRTAYPRKQEDCPNPKLGLSSVEAIYIAHLILNRDLSGLLDGYHWRQVFLEKNSL